MAKHKLPRPVWLLILGLCLFIGLLNFKPSEPYLTEYLTCNKNTQESDCDGKHSEDSCSSNIVCQWSTTTEQCTLIPCDQVALDQCGNDDFDYCEKDNETCQDASCYEHFTEDQVNNDIYPWSTYAYLPFLLMLGPFAELFSYRFAILFGILGRVVTRILLLFGHSMLEMQLMQVAYSLGTAAEDVFSAYIYYVIDVSHYQTATSYIKSSALIACLISGVLGDILVVEFNSSLRLLMWISAIFVWSGFMVGLFVIRASNKSNLISPKMFLRNVSDDDQESFISHDNNVNNNNNNELNKRADVTNPISLHIPDDSPDLSPEEPLNSLEEAKNNQNLSPKSSHTPPNISSIHSHHKSKPANHTFSFFSESPFDHNKSRTFRKSNSSSVLSASQYEGRSSSLDSILFSKTRRLKIHEKLHIFHNQLVYLWEMLKIHSNFAMLILWINGNAIFTILYNYEVSIYEELNGSNTWNGSVLAIMLLAGSIGAMIPSWMNHTRHVSTTNIGLMSGMPSDQELIVCIRISIALILSCITLFFFIFTWSLIPSIAFLAFFFATWQFINVIVYATLAEELKRIQMLTMKIDLHSDATSSVFNNHHIVDDIDELFSLHDPLDTHPTTTTTNNPMDDSMDQDSISSPTRKSLLKHNLSPNKTTNKENEEQQRQTSASPQRKNSLLPADVIDPPYSIAIVIIIACNVCLQIILQSILFSWLQNNLHWASWILVIYFMIASGCYLLFAIHWFGWFSLSQEFFAGIRWCCQCCFSTYRVSFSSN